MSTLDQVQNQPEEIREKFHQYVQKSLRRRYKRTKDQSEKEIDNATKRCS